MKRHPHHYRKHRYRIEDVEEYFVASEVVVVPPAVLSDAENRSHYDTGADDV
jgi:uncharacterized DUF497 family protein